MDEKHMGWDKILCGYFIDGFYCVNFAFIHFLSVFMTFTVTGKNAFSITFSDGILSCMSLDFGIYMPKHLAG